jgi:hypothetical protein
VTVGDLANLLPSAGPSAVFILVITVLLRLWLRAEKRGDGLAKQLYDERARLDEETAKRRKAEEELARYKRRKGGDLNA